jgi:hypothetical protein
LRPGPLVLWCDERDPDLRATVSVNGIREPGGHHAEDHHGAVVEHEGTADDGGIGAESPSPQVVPDQADCIGAGDLVCRCEELADEWTHRERVEERGGRDRSDDRFLPGAGPQREGGSRRRRKRRKGRRFVSDPLIHPDRQRTEPAHRRLVESQLDAGQPIGVLIGQRSQHDVVNDRESHGRRGDPNGENPDAEGCRRRRGSKTAPGITQNEPSRSEERGQLLERLGRDVLPDGNFDGSARPRDRARCGASRDILHDVANDGLGAGA